MRSPVRRIQSQGGCGQSAGAVFPKDSDHVPKPWLAGIGHAEMGAFCAGVSALAKARPVPPERKTSKFALKYAHYVGGGTAATCALATGVGIFSETAATNGPLGLLMATVSGLVLGGGLGATWFYLHDVAS